MAGLWDAITGGLGSLFGGVKNFGSALMGRGGGNASPVGASLSSMPQGFGGSVSGMGNGGGLGGMLGGGLRKLFGGGGMGGNMLGGLGIMGASQLIGNPKTPKMPDSFNQFQGMMNAGGTPGMQSANNYYQGVLNGTNQDAYEAASHSLDVNYQDELRKLNSMYKSLRPGTDPTSDSTYQRDLGLLNDQYSRSRAQTMAQVQQGAAQGASQLGTQQMQGLQSGIEAQLNQIATQWNMNYDQKQALRNALMGMGGNMVSMPYQMNLMKQMFGK